MSSPHAPARPTSGDSAAKPGMSIREHMALELAKSIVANKPPHSGEEMMRQAVRLADLLLGALNGC